MNAEDEELACETIIDDPLALGRQSPFLDPATSGWGSQQPPAPLVGNPWQPPTLLPPPPFGGGPFAFAAPALDSPTSTFGPTGPPPAPLPTPFNPFRPMIEHGLAPIVPLREDPPRLTAFQKPSESDPFSPKVFF